MSVPFSIRVSAEPACVGLAIDVTRRYVELRGGTAAEAESLVSAVRSALSAMTDDGQAIALEFTHGAGQIAVDVSCGSRRERCQTAVPSQP
jgi:hypothetical protein